WRPCSSETRRAGRVAIASRSLSASWGPCSPTAPSPRSSEHSPGGGASEPAPSLSSSFARSSGCSCPSPVRSRSSAGPSAGGGPGGTPPTRAPTRRGARGPAEMIRKVLDFKDLTAREVMVPRRHILGVELGMPLPEVVSIVSFEKHARYPVYRENIDNVVGLLYAKDLFVVLRDGSLATAKLADLLRTPVMFVSENQPAAKILQDMRSRRLHLAI